MTERRQLHPAEGSVSKYTSPALLDGSYLLRGCCGDCRYHSQRRSLAAGVRDGKQKVPFFFPEFDLNTDLFTSSGRREDSLDTHFWEVWR